MCTLIQIIAHNVRLLPCMIDSISCNDTMVYVQSTRSHGYFDAVGKPTESATISLLSRCPRHRRRWVSPATASKVLELGDVLARKLAVCLFTLLALSAFLPLSFFTVHNGYVRAMLALACLLHCTHHTAPSHIMLHHLQAFARTSLSLPALIIVATSLTTNLRHSFHAIYV